MVITVDLSNPDNDVELVGLNPGETAETRFGPRGYVAYRIFTAAARLLFLALQRSEKPDVAAATAMQIDRESSFIRQRLDELKPGGDAGRRRDDPRRGDGRDRSRR